MRPEKLIRRYEHNYFTGWVVAVKREGRRYPARYFSDKPEGRAAALVRAWQYRDELLGRVPKAHKLKRSLSTNTTGDTGVARVNDRTRAGSPAPRYVATWPCERNGVYGRAKASFSVALYGEAGAMRRAVRARRAGVAEFLATARAQVALKIGPPGQWHGAGGRRSTVHAGPLAAAYLQTSRRCPVFSD